MKPSWNQMAAWARHAADWRDPSQVCSQWRDAVDLDRRLLEAKVTGGWWDILDELRITLLVTREYEHLVIGASSRRGIPRLTYLPVPHPSGLAIDRSLGEVWLASTRNPNQVYCLRPTTAPLERAGPSSDRAGLRALVPVRSVFYPGALYLHDLAFIEGQLHGAAAGQNAIVRLGADGDFETRWWPSCVERRGRPDLRANYIQLNSIAAGRTLADSFFTASSARIARRRPGHLNYPVLGRGVVFSGRTRDPMATGLTRPHSARLWRRQVWVANSGFGEVGRVSAGRLEVVAQLPGWTRGLCMNGDVAFVGTSRVIPRYAAYAPGLDPSRSRCAVHAISCTTGAWLGSIEWPHGNQVFAIDWIGRDLTPGLPFGTTRPGDRERRLFFTFRTR